MVVSMENGFRRDGPIANSCHLCRRRRRRRHHHVGCSLVGLLAIVLLVDRPRSALAVLTPLLNNETLVNNATNTNNSNATNGTVKLLVQYKNEEGRKATIEAAEVESLESESTRFQAASIQVNETQVDKVVGKLNSNPDIEFVEIDYLMSTLPIVVVEQQEEEGLDADANYNEKKYNLVGGGGGGGRGRQLQPANEIPYGIDMVQAPQVWNIPHSANATEEVMKVCVVDTGYGLGHSDLPNVTSHGVQGWSPRDTSYGVWNIDGNSHGTHCAGTIGALSNQVGVVGVWGPAAGAAAGAPQQQRFQFVIAKGLADSGFGSSSTVIAGVQACVEAGAKVISLSLGGGGYSTISNNIYRDLYNEGVLVIAAAGNDGTAGYSYPASYPHVMSVAAVNADGNRPPFSQFNNQVEIAAPGVAVWSTVTRNAGTSFGYAAYTGTSMATPHVAGVAALVWSHFPHCTNHQIRNVLLRTATAAPTAGPTSCNVEYGHGIVNAQAAYDLLASQGCEGAGGVNPVPLSSNNVGGCAQDPNYIPPPPVNCSAVQEGSKTFRVEITTDNYPQETTWELRDVNGNLEDVGGPYRSVRTNFTTHLCLSTALERYRFTIFDSYGDGLCCRYGLGSYRLYYDNEEVWAGAVFTRSEMTEFPQVLSSPTSSSPTTAPTTTLPTAGPTNSPTADPTARPSSSPTVSPSNVPTTATPTASPTMSPTSVPSARPTRLPTTSAPLPAVATALPVAMTTPMPTAMPTLPPTTTSPTFLPTTMSPTDKPTLFPTTVLPTEVPTHRPTTAMPSTSPTTFPTTTLPSASPQEVPTFAPVTEKPSQRPTTMVPTTMAPQTSPTVAPQVSPTVAPQASPTMAPHASPTTTPHASPTVAPVPPPTDSPVISTAAPVVPLSDDPPPTSLPTPPPVVVVPPLCEAPNKLFYLKLRTDTEPQETTWELVWGEQQVTGLRQEGTSRVVASGGPYQRPGTMYERYVCLAPPPSTETVPQFTSSSSSSSLGRSVYTFTIYDDNGLRRGRPKGRYEVFLNGKRMRRGKRFFVSQTVDFFPAQCFQHEEGFCDRYSRRQVCCTKKCQGGTCFGTKQKKNKKKKNKNLFD